MRDVCHSHGALFILDEVMCGMGRTGTLHAWQAENVLPDLQTMAKGLGAGYQSMAAMLVSPKVVDVLKMGTNEFIHGQTYQGMPVHAAAGLVVLSEIQKLLPKVSKLAIYLESQLKTNLSNHPNVGDIRGIGYFLRFRICKK